MNVEVYMLILCNTNHNVISFSLVFDNTGKVFRIHSSLCLSLQVPLWLSGPHLFHPKGGCPRLSQQQIYLLPSGSCFCLVMGVARFRATLIVGLPILLLCYLCKAVLDCPHLGNGKRLELHSLVSKEFWFTHPKHLGVSTCLFQKPPFCPLLLLTLSV